MFHCLPCLTEIIANPNVSVGQLIANGVLKALVNNSSQWSYRIPFAVQWAWPLPLFVLVAFSPESPWWLAKKERYGDAAISLHRLSNRTESDVQNSLAQIVYTIRLEKARIARSKEKAAAAARPASARNNTASQTHQHSNSWLARFTRHRVCSPLSSLTCPFLSSMIYTSHL